MFYAYPWKVVTVAFTLLLSCDQIKNTRNGSLFLAYPLSAASYTTPFGERLSSINPSVPLHKFMIVKGQPS